MKYYIAIAAGFAAAVSAAAAPRPTGPPGWGNGPGESCAHGEGCMPDTFCVFVSPEAEKRGDKTCESDAYAFKFVGGNPDPNFCNKGEFCIMEQECCDTHECVARKGETQTYCLAKANKGGDTGKPGKGGDKGCKNHY